MKLNRKTQTKYKKNGLSLLATSILILTQIGSPLQTAYALTSQNSENAPQSTSQKDNVPLNTTQSLEENMVNTNELSSGSSKSEAPIISSSINSKENVPENISSDSNNDTITTEKLNDKVKVLSSGDLNDNFVSWKKVTENEQITWLADTGKTKLLLTESLQPTDTKNTAPLFNNSISETDTNSPITYAFNGGDSHSSNYYYRIGGEMNYPRVAAGGEIKGDKKNIHVSQDIQYYKNIDKNGNPELAKVFTYKEFSDPDHYDKNEKDNKGIPFQIAEIVSFDTEKVGFHHSVTFKYIGKHTMDNIYVGTMLDTQLEDDAAGIDDDYIPLHNGSSVIPGSIYLDSVDKSLKLYATPGINSTVWGGHYDRSQHDGGGMAWPMIDQTPLNQIDAMDTGDSMLAYQSSGVTLSPGTDVNFEYTELMNLQKSPGVDVKYIDEDGETIHSKTHIDGLVGRDYDATTSEYKLSIDGYELDTSQLPQNAKGILSDQAQTVTYVYKKEQGTVKIEYLDLDFNELAPSQTIQGNVGDHYNARDNILDIPGYTLIYEPDNIEGTIKKEMETVTFLYKKDTPAQDVTVKYQDENGKDIHDSQTISGNVGESYDATTSKYKLNIDGYNLDTSKLPQNAKGTLSDKAQTVTYIYEVNEEPINPDPDGPSPTPGTEGDLSLDFVPHLYFGLNAITNQTERYNAYAVPIEQSGKVVRYDPNYVQVTDQRKDSTGWSLTVAETDPFTTESGNTLGESTQILFSDSYLTSLSGDNSGTIPSFTANSIQLVPNNEAQNVVIAQNHEGNGTWKNSWGIVSQEQRYTEVDGQEQSQLAQVQVNSSVQLQIPGNIKKTSERYVTNLDWVLSDTPNP